MFIFTEKQIFYMQTFRFEKIKLMFSEDVQILLDLYSIKKGTLLDISKSINKYYKTGKIYSIKDALIRMKILVPTSETRTIKKGNGTTETIVYRIEHEIIDKIFCTELPTRILYDRFLDGKIPFITFENLPNFRMKSLGLFNKGRHNDTTS